jgi:hypothetical protein
MGDLYDLCLYVRRRKQHDLGSAATEYPLERFSDDLDRLTEAMEVMRKAETYLGGQDWSAAQLYQGASDENKD